MVEHLTENQGVAGSNPALGTNSELILGPQATSPTENVIGIEAQILWVEGSIPIEDIYAIRRHLDRAQSGGCQGRSILDAHVAVRRTNSAMVAALWSYAGFMCTSRRILVGPSDDTCRN